MTSEAPLPRQTPHLPVMLEIILRAVRAVNFTVKKLKMTVSGLGVSVNVNEFISSRALGWLGSQCKWPLSDPSLSLGAGGGDGEGDTKVWGGRKDTGGDGEGQMLPKWCQPPYLIVQTGNDLRFLPRMRWKWKWKSLSHVWLQARILEWVAFPFSRGSSQPRDRT